MSTKLNERELKCVEAILLVIGNDEADLQTKEDGLVYLIRKTTGETYIVPDKIMNHMVEYGLIEAD
jgi:hypothetical protein